MSPGIWWRRWRWGWVGMTTAPLLVLVEVSPDSRRGLPLRSWASGSPGVGSCLRLVGLALPGRLCPGPWRCAVEHLGLAAGVLAEPVRPRALHEGGVRVERRRRLLHCDPGAVGALFCTATLEQWARCAVRSGCGLALCNLDFNLYICPLPFSPSSWRSVIVAPLLTFEQAWPLTRAMPWPGAPRPRPQVPADCVRPLPRDERRSTR